MGLIQEEAARTISTKFFLTNAATEVALFGYVFCFLNGGLLNAKSSDIGHFFVP